MGLIRLFLACVVAMDHYSIPILHPLGLYVHYYAELGMDAGHAVLWFYMISGFLISYALEHKYKERGSLWAFYRSRFIRIFPLYWALLAIFVVLNAYGARDQLARQLFHGHAADALFGIGLIGVDWRLSLASYPDVHWQALPAGLAVAWTLGAELAFYMIAPLLVRSLPAAIVLFVTSLAVRLSFVHAFGYSEIWVYHFFPSTVMFFLLGHFARLAYEQTAHRFGHWHLLFGVAAVAFTIEAAGRQFDHPLFYAGIVSTALFVPYAFDTTKDMRWSNFLGNLSYPLYLSHHLVLHAVYSVNNGLAPPDPASASTSVGAILNRLIFSHSPKAISGTVSGYVFVLCCIAMATILHLWVERPLTKLLRVRSLPALRWVAESVGAARMPAMPSTRRGAGRQLAHIEHSAAKDAVNYAKMTDESP